MSKPVVDRLRYVVNVVDRALGLRIYPRDRIYLATMSSPATVTARSLLIDPRAYGFDMAYYAAPFFHDGRRFLCFHATRLRSDGTSSSHLVILDERNAVVWTVAAHDIGLDHFASPQVIDGKRLTVLFCARRGSAHALYSMDITDFIRRRPRLLLRDVSEQSAFLYRGRRYLLYVRTGEATFRLASMDAAGKPREHPIRFRVRSPHRFLANPSVAVDGKTIYVFCRLSTKNALGSSIVSFTSRDCKTFVQTSFALKPRPGIEHHATAFPSFVREDGTWHLYYTGYWGRHLLERFTLRRWSNP